MNSISPKGNSTKKEEEVDLIIERTKSYLEQLLRFVDFKENVCLLVNYLADQLKNLVSKEKTILRIIRKFSEIKKEVQADVEIGYSVNECKTLLFYQDNLELRCSELYGQYAVLRHQAAEALQEKHFLLNQITEYRETLEKACLSLAASLVGRRNLIAASEKFHLILFEFRQKVQEVRNFARTFEDSGNRQCEIEALIEKIYILIDQICNIAGAVTSQGLQLLQVLYKLNLHKDLERIHRQHIGGWMTFVEVERDFRLTELNRLALNVHCMWQLKSCENGVTQAVEWLKDLSAAMLSRATEVGETAEEADALFLQHIQFKDAGEESLKLGMKLVYLARNIRKSIKSDGNDLQTDLERVWEDFWTIFRGISKRLDLCQNFYRNAKKEIKRLRLLEDNIRSSLVVFGVIRRSFVVHRHKKAWTQICRSIEVCLRNGRYLLQCLKQPLLDSHRVNLLSSSATIQILRTMSETEKTVQQVQATYFNDELTSTDSATAEYVSARSPDTWKSTSISGVEDWCSVGSDGATLDDFKSIDDDLAEEYLTDDNVEDLPLNGQSATEEGAASSSRRGSALKEYVAVTGIQEVKSKKYASNIQPVVVSTALSSDYENAAMSSGAGNKATLPGVKGTATSISTQSKESDETLTPHSEMLVVVSPKVSTSFEPPRYSSVITKKETTDVKTDVQKSYEVKTLIKAGGISETFTSQTSEATQVFQPDSKVEKVHKITMVEEPGKVHPGKTPIAQGDFPKSMAFGSQAKTDLLSEIEGLKSKYLKKSTELTKPTEVKSESKSENVSYGFSSFPGVNPAETDISKVLYSKEVTESHSMTSISFQQQSFGVNRSERWQSVTPQRKVQQVAQILPATTETEQEHSKLKTIEENIKKFQS